MGQTRSLKCDSRASLPCARTIIRHHHVTVRSASHSFSCGTCPPRLPLSRNALTRAPARWLGVANPSVYSIPLLPPAEPHQPQCHPARKTAAKPRLSLFSSLEGKEDAFMPAWPAWDAESSMSSTSVGRRLSVTALTIEVPIGPSALARSISATGRARSGMLSNLSNQFWWETHGRRSLQMP